MSLIPSRPPPDTPSLGPWACGCGSPLWREAGKQMPLPVSDVTFSLSKLVFFDVGIPLKLHSGLFRSRAWVALVWLF